MAVRPGKRDGSLELGKQINGVATPVSGFKELMN
jgi:hypothetical protein